MTNRLQNCEMETTMRANHEDVSDLTIRQPGRPTALIPRLNGFPAPGSPPGPAIMHRIEEDLDQEAGCWHVTSSPS